LYKEVIVGRFEWILVCLAGIAAGRPGPIMAENVKSEDTAAQLDIQVLGQNWGVL